MSEVINRTVLREIIREELAELLRERDEAQPPTPPQKKYLTVDDISQITGWHRQHVYRLAKLGRLPKIPNMGREVKFAPEIVERLADRGLQPEG